MDIIYSSDCLDFYDNSLPESPERVKLAARYLQKEGYNFIEAKTTQKKDLLTVHTEEFVDNIKNYNFYDRECPHYDNLFYYCRLAAGAAIQAAKLKGFSLMRPPGHHAGKDYPGGFCFFNNLAIAVESQQKQTLIIDIDAHHGNGTQDIFKNRDDIFYLSLHKAIYPGTGRTSGNNFSNHTFYQESGDDKYLKVLDRLLKIKEQKDFQLIAISAGFDASQYDPLGSLGITPEGYYRIGKKIASLNIDTFCVLEGGYHPETLGENIHHFIQGLSNKKEF